MDAVQQELKAILDAHGQPATFTRWQTTIEWKIPSSADGHAVQRQVLEHFFGDRVVQVTGDDLEECPAAPTGTDDSEPARGRPVAVNPDDWTPAMIEWLEPILWIGLSGADAAVQIGELPYVGDFFRQPTLADRFMKKAGGDRMLVSFHDGSPWLLATLPDRVGSFRRDTP